MKVCLFFMLLCIIACSPKVRSDFNTAYDLLPSDEKVAVLYVDEPVPTDAKQIGEVKVSDTGISTRCDYQTVIEAAKFEASKGGGNLIKIIEHKPPSRASTCHRIKALVYYLDNIFEYARPERDVFNQDADYALLHIYRPRAMGSMVNYDLYLDNVFICNVTHKCKRTFEIRREGKYTLWAETESRHEVPIEIKFGHEYYLRCGIQLGIIIVKPMFELLDESIASLEFETMDVRE